MSTVTLYSREPGLVNGLTVEGEEIPRSEDGGFLVTAAHVADLLAFLPGLTSERPEGIKAPEAVKPKKAAKIDANPEATKAEE